MSNKSHFTQITGLLKMESDAIAETARRLRPSEAEHAVELLSTCGGKVVLIGVGKSGNIAQKIAATMTSTGTVAVFLHPSDASHGGLGLVSSDDVVILISNSGETAELIDLLPPLEHRGVKVIAIVGNLRSTLARRADAVLDASVEQEACPLNLAPTTSTTVALAIGDALAMTLMQVKGFKAEDFALNHPAGRLGKRLTLRVCDLMHEGSDGHISVANGASLLEVVQAISRGGFGAVNVVNEAGRLAGIITDGDVRRTLQKCGLDDLEKLDADAVMTRHPVIATPDMLAHAALQLMEDRPSQISVLPVVDGEGRALGLIRVHDIVRSGV